MANPQEVLARRVQDGLAVAFGEAYRDTDPLIRPSQHADFQANVALSLARRLGRPPREVAAELARSLRIADICLEPQVSGPGFINLTLRDDWIAGQAGAMLANERLGVDVATAPQTVVVEYSSPNIAKEMHVGHLRTTIVGDAIARVLDFAGHNVIRDNHVGDWGTPFGMLIEHLLDVGEGSAEAGLLETDPNAFYQAARAKFDSDPAFADRSRQRVVLLHGGDPGTLRLWQELVDLSKEYLHRMYGRLRVTLTDDDIRGESFYNAMLADVVADLSAQGLAVENEGALCVFPPGFTGRDGSPLPVIVRKSDGAYNYSTTDLATIRYRVDELNCDRAIYVVGSAQALHFRMVFAVAREAGWIPETASFEHAQIGNVLGTDGKLLRTRSGGTIKLSDLLQEGVDRARGILDEVEASSRFDESAVQSIAEAVGIGAVKYADLSTARDSEYVFDWDRMISFKGNTGPYLQYATARIRSIFRKAGLVPEQAAAPIILVEQAERALAMKLLDFGAVVPAVAETAEPHRLCTYLFEVASMFTAFYENCPVLKADDDEVRASRLAVCALTLRVLVTGLDLLGVPVPERM
ncbi:MAG TPA: arginine--tRNA ligase [Streptosporangiaceae bacterium]|nr:arginine--tRNA ligase [Streptosporangiaceae bacterium]